MAIIVPSRSRPENISRLANSLKETKTNANFFVVLDEDDSKLENYEKLNCADIIIAPKGNCGVTRPLNFAASKLKNKFLYFMFMGDDHVPRTENWDLIFEEKLYEKKYGVAYGNDLLQGRNLATAVCMTQNIVFALNGMAPTSIQHLYIDNFWMQLGRDLNSLHYLENVIIEHLHPSCGKANWDESYRLTNSGESFNLNRKAFENYISSDDYQKLLKKITKAYMF